MELLRKLLIYCVSINWHEKCIKVDMDIKRPNLQRKKRNRQMLYGGAVMAALIVGGVAVSALEPAAPKVEKASLWTGIVQRGEFVRDVRARGRLVSSELRSIAAATDGRVERVLVKPGAQVDSDTVIVELSNPGLIQLMQEAGWALEAAEAELKSLQAELGRKMLEAEGDVALVEIELRGVASDVEADRELAEKGVISRRQYRNSKGKAEQLSIRLELYKERLDRLSQSIEAQLAAQHARVEQARRLHQRRQEQVYDLRIRAGIPGVLTQVAVEEGQQLVLGAKVARVAKPDELIAELVVNEVQARDIQMGQNVIVDTRNGTVSGQVTRIDPAVRNGTVQVDVELTGNLPLGARPDLSVEGTIEIERIPNTLFVNRPGFGNAFTESSLFRIENNQYAHRVPVRFGRVSVQHIEITKNLIEGDEVVLSETDDWREFQRLRLY